MNQWMLVLLFLTAFAPSLTVQSSASAQESCTTDACLEQKSYEMADASMSAGEWLKASKLPKSSPANLTALLITGTVLFKWNGKSHCKPERADVNQATAIAVQFFQDHPQIWHLDAPHGIAAALGNVWPCNADNGD